MIFSIGKLTEHGWDTINTELNIHLEVNQMHNKKILIADDEYRMRKMIGDFLKRDGFKVVEAENGEEAIEVFLEEKDIDLVILDVMMPEVDGWIACREIRKKSVVPIIMLTARSQEYDELFGFEIGADEYITKPFSPLILVARIKALLKRTENVRSNIEDINGMKLNREGRIVKIGNEVVDLTPTEYDLLIYLLDNKGRACSRAQILDAVWGADYFGNDRTVDTHINRLRIKLKRKSAMIKTVRGYGYIFEV